MPHGWRSLGHRAAAMPAPVRGRVGRECGHCFSDLTVGAVGSLTCGPNRHLARMSVTHQLHLQLRLVNVALTFWRDADRFRREARTSDGRGFGRPGRSDAGVVVKCELMDDEPLKHMRDVLTTKHPCKRSCRQLAFDDHH